MMEPVSILVGFIIGVASLWVLRVLGALVAIGKSRVFTERELAKYDEAYSEEKDKEAWRLVRKSQKSVALQLKINPEWIVPLQKEIPGLVEGIAKIYYPDLPEPILAPRVDEWARMSQQVSTDLAEFLQANPVGKLLNTRGDRARSAWSLARRFKDNPAVQKTSKYWKKVRPVVQLINARNPLTQANVVLKNLAGRSMQYYLVGKFGARCIDFYSGQFGERDSSRVESC